MEFIPEKIRLSNGMFKKIISVLKKNIHIFIPIICLFMWAFLALYRDGFILAGYDSHIFYSAGKAIFTDINNVYGGGYYYLPSFAVLYSIISFLFDFHTSEWIFFVILLIFGIYSIILFDKILVLKGWENKFIRFLCLIVISNGHKIFLQFDGLNVKIITLCFLLLLIKREIEHRNKNNSKEFHLKFLFIQFTILSLIIAVIPYAFFIIPIYLLNGVKINELFDKEQLKKYILFGIIIISQNFMFLINPNMLFQFFTGIMFTTSNAEISSILSCLYIIFNLQYNIVLPILSFSLMTFFTLYAIFKNDSTIEFKFGIYFLFSIFFSIYIRPSQFIAIIPLILILFVDVVNNDIKEIKDYKKVRNYTLFIKENYLFLLVLICLTLMLFFPGYQFIYRIIPFIQIIPVQIIILYYTILNAILLIDLIILLSKNQNYYVKHEKIV